MFYDFSFAFFFINHTTINNLIDSRIDKCLKLIILFIHKSFIIYGYFGHMTPLFVIFMDSTKKRISWKIGKKGTENGPFKNEPVMQSWALGQKSYVWTFTFSWFMSSLRYLYYCKKNIKKNKYLSFFTFLSNYWWDPTLTSSKVKSYIFFSYFK